MKIDGADSNENIPKSTPKTMAKAGQAFREALAEKSRELAEGEESDKRTAKEMREEDWNSFLEKFKVMGIKEAVYEEYVEKLKEEAKAIVLKREGLEEEDVVNVPEQQYFLLKSSVELELKKLIIAANELEVEQANKERESIKGAEVDTNTSMTTSDISA